jgi:undecaprenyl-diphosphatase
MSWIDALIIGLLQGLTEFLPISSSAHLKLAKLFLGVEPGEASVLLDLFCHMGTLVAVVLFLWKDIVEIFMRQQLLFTAMLPLIPCYFLLKPLRDMASQTEYLGFALMATAGILFLGHRLRLREERAEKTMFDVLCIGAMQSAALIPGISRSASTISCARVLGWTAEESVRFSFLLSVPTIIAGSCVESLKCLFSSAPLPASVSFSSCLIGFLTSWGVGLLSIRMAMRWLERGHLKPFAWYCLLLGVSATLYFYLL